MSLRGSSPTWVAMLARKMCCGEPMVRTATLLPLRSLIEGARCRDLGRRLGRHDGGADAHRCRRTGERGANELPALHAFGSLSSPPLRAGSYRTNRIGVGLCALVGVMSDGQAEFATTRSISASKSR